MRNSILMCRSDSHSDYFADLNERPTFHEGFWLTVIFLFLEFQNKIVAWLSGPITTDILMKGIPFLAFIFGSAFVFGVVIDNDRLHILDLSIRVFGLSVVLFSGIILYFYPMEGFVDWLIHFFWILAESLTFSVLIVGVSRSSKAVLWTAVLVSGYLFVIKMAYYGLQDTLVVVNSTKNHITAFSFNMLFTEAWASLVTGVACVTTYFLTGRGKSGWINVTIYTIVSNIYIAIALFHSLEFSPIFKLLLLMIVMIPLLLSFAWLITKAADLIHENALQRGKLV